MPERETPFLTTTRASVESMDSLRYLFDHPALTRAQEDLIFSIGQHDPYHPAGVEAMVPRDSISALDLRSHPSFSAFLEAFSPRDRQRSETLLGQSSSLTEYLVRHYQKRVFKIARAAQEGTIGIHLQELFQEGNIGLTKAINRYDPKKLSPTTNQPAAFSTFSTTVIRNTIITEVRKRHRKLGVPLHVAHALKLYQAEVESLARALGATPTDSQIRDRFSSSGVMDPDLVEMFLKKSTLDFSVQSLNTVSNEEERVERIDDVPAQDSSGEAAVAEAEMLANLLDRLPDAERFILTRRGFGGGEKESLRAIGASANISYEKVRQIEWKAIELLRQLLKAEIRGEEPATTIVTPDHKYPSHFRQRNREEMESKKKKIAELIKSGETGPNIAAETGASKSLITAIRKNLRASGEIPPAPDPSENQAKIAALMDEGKSDMEVAIALNKPIRTVSSLRRAKQLLRTNPDTFKSIAEEQAAKEQSEKET